MLLRIAETKANIPVTSSSPTPAPSSENSTTKSVADRLLRLKRQYFLQKELSSAADESENLAIEEVEPLNFT